MTLPTVSIVIPAFNAAPFIGQALESIAALVYPRNLLDVYIVDDGSKDGTPELAEQAMAQREISGRVIKQSNRGPSAARNVGWREARGEWVQFLDADDLIAPAKLQVQTADAAIEDARTAVVYSDWTALPIEAAPLAWSGLVAERRPRLGGDVACELLEADKFIQLGSALYRRTWLERVGGFDERYRLIEDVELHLRVALAGGGFAHAPTQSAVFVQRLRGDSLSRESFVRFLDGCVRNARFMESVWREKQGDLTAAQKRVLLEVYGGACRNYFDCDRMRGRELWSHIQKIDARYIPPGNRLLRLLTRLLGYDKAEGVALIYRRAKRRMLS